MIPSRGLGCRWIFFFFFFCISEEVQLTSAWAAVTVCHFRNPPQLLPGLCVIWSMTRSGCCWSWDWSWRDVQLDYTACSRICKCFSLCLLEKWVEVLSQTAWCVFLLQFSVSLPSCVVHLSRSTMSALWRCFNIRPEDRSKAYRNIWHLTVQWMEEAFAPHRTQFLLRWIYPTLRLNSVA